MAGSSRLSPAKRAVMRFGERYPWHRPTELAVGLTLIGVGWFTVHLYYDDRPGPGVALSFVIIILAFGILGLTWWKRSTLRLLLDEEKRSPSELCPECGYVTRGLEEPRCPECGTSLRDE